MQENIDIPKLLALRKLTKAISVYLEKELSAYLQALAPAFNAGLTFGEHIQGIKQSVKGSGEAINALQELYRTLAKSNRFAGRLSEIKPPLAVFGKSLEITRVVYDYKTGDGTESKIIKVRSPLKWTLGYYAQGVNTLKELLATQARSGDTSLDICVLNLLVLHFIASSKTGPAKILKALRFQVNSEPSPKLGGLPLVYISSPVSTMLPPDDLIIQSTELSGTDFFEEIVNTDDIDQLKDPLQEQLAALIQ